MFKAISQALHSGNESHCTEIRGQVVHYILSQVWDKYKHSMEIQHVYGNEELATSWTSDPMAAYKDYMNCPGTLGSLSELTAAAELFRFNFATIQVS